MPCVFRPLTKPGPAEMPTMAMKMLRPTEFMNQTVGVGMRPKDGRTERSQPHTIPAIERAAGGRQRQRHPCHLEDQRADQRADHDRRRRRTRRRRRRSARSATPSSLVAALVSCVRPTRVRMSPRSILVFGRMGIVGGGRAPRDLPQEDAARAGQLGQLGERLAVDRLVASPRRRRPPPARPAAPGPRPRSRFAPSTFTSTSRLPATATTSPSFRTVSAVASSITPLRRMRRTKTRASGTSASASAARRPTALPPGCTGTRAAPSGARPSRPRPAPSCRPVLLLVVLAGGDEIDAEQLRAEDGDHDRRAHGAEHVGHGVGDRHRVDQGLGLVGGQAQPVDGVGREAHRGGNRLRPRVEPGRVAEVVAGDLCDHDAGPPG